MTLKRYKHILTIFILGLGLISCSEDSEVQYKDDDFQPNDLQIERGDRSLLAIENLTTIGLSDQLTINEPSVTSSEQIKNLEITTTCKEQFGAEISSQTTRWPNPSKIATLDILPLNVLAKKSSETHFCDIEYTFTNQNSSTYTRLVKKVRFDNMPAFTNLPGSHFFNKTDVINWTQEQNTVVTSEAKLESLIACDDFQTHVHATTEGITLKEFLPQERIQQHQMRSSTQSCRVVFKSNNGIQVSPVFVLELPKINPDVHYSFSARSANVSLVDSQQKVILDITNPNAFPITLKFYSSSLGLMMRGVVSQDGNVYFSKTHNLSLSWDWSGTTAIVQGTEIIFEVPKLSSVRLIGSVSGRLYSNANRVHSLDYPTPERGRPASNAADWRSSIVSDLGIGVIYPILMGYNMGLSREDFLNMKETSDIYVPINAKNLQANSVVGDVESFSHWDISFAALRGMRMPHSSLNTLIPALLQNNYEGDVLLQQ